MMGELRSWCVAALAALMGTLGTFAIGASAAAQYGAAPTRLDCARMPCAEVLPGAVRFEREEGHAFETGYDASGEAVGWVALTVELVDVVAYSGHPIVVLFGLDREGVITGTHLEHHAEPILLTGIPVSELLAFIAYYQGHRADERISVGSAAREEGVVTVTRTRTDEAGEQHEEGAVRFGAVDVISGATVTALAANRTILDAARLVGTTTGVIDATAERTGRFVAGDEPWTWARMEAEGVFGRLTVTEREMGFDTDGTFIDLWFTIADSPAIGGALIPRGDYAYLQERLHPGEHLVVILGNGSSSFKGSGFVRGGIFDRVRVQQGLGEIQFRDIDYLNLPRLAAPDAPRFREGAVFITRDGHLDPGSPFSLVFLGSRLGHGRDRDFRSFDAEHTLPASVYQTDELPEELSVWEAAWQNRRFDVLVLGLWLLIVAGIFSARRYTFTRLANVKRLHVTSMIVSFGLVGVHLRAQPSVTQMLTLVGTLAAPLRGETMRTEVFLTEPLLFILWIFIAITSLVFGRGVFCGWVCPYGVMTELAFKVGKLLKLPQRDLPDAIHGKLRYVRYGILAVLIALFLVEPPLGERAAEVEPFKSTFLVPFWTREWMFIAWWVLLFGLSVFSWRPFCRYVCPMGAGLALFNSFRLAGPKRRQYCSHCKICQRGCEPKAIADDGTIDPRECLSCMECEATYHEEKICPPLVGIDRLLQKKDRAPKDDEKLAQLQKEKEPIGWHAPRR
jgi:NosR/NirI family nitrous oxide reductase transcriptional regulator